METEATRIPGPDHPIALGRGPRHVVVRAAGGRVAADTRRALTLREAALPPVHYIPREDVAMALLRRSARRTHCPWKGDAAHFDIVPPDGGGTPVEAVAWSYEAPFPAVAAIAGHLAFYPDRVEAIEVADAQGGMLHRTATRLTGAPWIGPMRAGA